MNNLKVELNDEQLTTVLHTALLQAVSDKGLVPWNSPL